VAERNFVKDIASQCIKGLAMKGLVAIHCIPKYEFNNTHLIAITNFGARAYFSTQDFAYYPNFMDEVPCILLLTH
jgi:hypothetical protein